MTSSQISAFVSPNIVQNPEKQTFVVVIIDEIFSSDHVQQLQYPSAIKLRGLRAGEHRHGLNTHIKPRRLSEANTGTINFDLDITQFHIVEAFYGDASGGGVDIFAKSDALA